MFTGIAGHWKRSCRTLIGRAPSASSILEITYRSTRSRGHGQSPHRARHPEHLRRRRSRVVLSGGRAFSITEIHARTTQPRCLELAARLTDDRPESPALQPGDERLACPAQRGHGCLHLSTLGHTCPQMSPLPAGTLSASLLRRKR
jgi:hypothetical protein